MDITGPWQDAVRGAGLLRPDGSVAASIFAEMSALAARTGALNLGQGFPDYAGPPQVLEAAVRAIRDGDNQYPPGLGTPQLRQAIAEHQRRFYGLELDPGAQVLVTAGATEAIAASLLALVRPGDEVLTVEPFYDAYGAVIALARGIHRTVPLRDGDLDHEELAAAVSDRTRVILVNTPHNPTGTVLPRATLVRIVELAERHDAVIVTDEVYEHLAFDAPHIPIATLPGGFERTLTISSGGKTFSTTGWKIGWITGPAALVQAVLAVKQFLTYVNGAPFQSAIALGLGLPDAVYDGIRNALQAKRELLAAGLREAGFGIRMPAAGYFIVADAAPLGRADAAEFCLELPQRAGVVAIPMTAFCRDHAEQHRSLLRFAYCKDDAVLEEAVRRLTALK